MGIQKIVGLNVRKARLAADLSQEGLVARLEHVADSTALDQGYISRLESGRHNPALVTLWHVAEALGVPLTYLVAEGDNKKT